MRLFFLLTIIANIGLYAYGQGLFGPPPHEAGRYFSPPAALNAAAIVLGPPVAHALTLH